MKRQHPPTHGTFPVHRHESMREEFGVEIQIPSGTFLRDPRVVFAVAVDPEHDDRPGVRAPGYQPGRIGPS
jgi:hypothetical protein